MTDAVDFRVVIPARYGSHRLPAKALCDVGGRPLVLHVWDRAMEAGAMEALVATDDERIAAAVETEGGRAWLTSREHASGTDRIAEVAQRGGWPDDAIVVNLQGDEPLVPPSLLRRLATALSTHPGAGIATAAVPIRMPETLFDPNTVKVVCDDEGFALYFSRAPIPWVRERFDPHGRPPELPEDGPFLRHLGLYAYRVGTLRRVAAAPGSALERLEQLEQLRALAMGIRIHVSLEPEAHPPGVDTHADLDRVRRLLAP